MRGRPRLPEGERRDKRWPIAVSDEEYALVRSWPDAATWIRRMIRSRNLNDVEVIKSEIAALRTEIAERAGKVSALEERLRTLEVDVAEHPEKFADPRVEGVIADYERTYIAHRGPAHQRSWLMAICGGDTDLYGKVLARLNLDAEGGGDVEP